MRKLLYVGSLILMVLSVQNASADPTASNWGSMGFNGILENSKDIGPAAIPMLDKLANDLKQRGDFASVKIEGYTDAGGDPGYNLSLSQKRAEKVRDYLVKLGLPKEKIQARGSGATHPIASNSSETGRALNRRVEITVEWNDRKTASTN